jgi:hypothetical protein
MKRLLFVLICLLIASPTHAQSDNPEMTGQFLYQLCNDKSELSQGECSSWIYGFARGMGVAQLYADKQHLTPPGARRPTGSPTTCLSDELTGTQARLIIEKFMRDHPELLHHLAAGIAGAALVQAFPCN